MQTQDYIKDLEDIKTLMAERSRFLSLSGLSGILSGVYALVGAYIALQMASSSSTIAYADIRDGTLTPIVIQLGLLAGLILIFSVATAFYFTYRKAKKNEEKIWSAASIKALKGFLLPLGTGGLFGLLLVYKGYLLLVAPTTLIFYGLALYAASRYTYRDVAVLGLLEIILGFGSMVYSGYGLYFWAFGFGVLHIIYGVIMYYKYDRNLVET